MNRFWKIAGIVLAIVAAMAAVAYFLPKLCPSCSAHMKVLGRREDSCCDLSDEQDDANEDEDSDLPEEE